MAKYFPPPLKVGMELLSIDGKAIGGKSRVIIRKIIDQSVPPHGQVKVYGMQRWNPETQQWTEPPFHATEDEIREDCTTLDGKPLLTPARATELLNARVRQAEINAYGRAPGQ